MKKYSHFKKGFTLIELILAIAISSMIIIVIFSLFTSNTRLYKETSKEFDIQSQVRYASEVINQSIRYSTVSFAVLEDHYNGEEAKLTDDWNYLGLSQNKDEFIHYKWDKENKKHEKEIIIAKNEGFYYDLSFHQNKDDINQKTINYDLKISKLASNSTPDEKKIVTEIKTGVEAINAIQIVDRGIGSNKKAIALAYRTDPTPKAESQKAAVAMVLDNSGSMAWNMTGDENSGKWRTIIGDFKVNGVKQEIGKPAKGSSGQMLEINTWYYNSGNNLYRAYSEPKGYKNRGYVIKDDLVSRISILKNQAQLLVDQLFTNKIEGDLVLVPFSTKGEPVKNTPGNKYEFDIKNEQYEIKNKIGEMTANGGTNTGDGLRRAYYLLDDINKNSPRRNYLIVLVDGVTTYYSGTKNNFYLASGNAPSVNGYGSKLDDTGEEYVKEIGKMIKGEGPYKNHDIKTFVISFSDKWENGKYSELESVNTIAEACGIGKEHHFDIKNRNNPVKDNPERVFWAKDEESLQNVFDSISKYIEADFWQVSGPDNK